MRTATIDQRKNGSASPCVLVHGLTADVGQWDEQRDLLRAAGHPVAVPRLAGHGTSPRDLDAIRWQDWYADILRVCSTLALNQPVNYAGLSLGGLLGLQLAIERPDLIRRLVVIGVPLRLPTWVETVYRVIRYTPLRWIVRGWPKEYSQSVAEPTGRARYQALGYREFPLAAAVQLKKLQLHVIANLHRITMPITVVHSYKDRTALPAGVDMLRQQVRGPVTVHWLDYSYHVVTMDYDKDWLGEFLVKEFA